MTTHRSDSHAAPLACARVRVLLEAYVDGDLAGNDPALAARILSHLSTCDDCRRQHEQAVSLPFRLKALRSPAPPPALVDRVMASIAPMSTSSRRAWALLIPEALLLAFVLWYLSGLNGLVSVTSGALSDFLALAGWGAGSSSLPDIPAADVFLLTALIALSATAAYHISVLARLNDAVSHRDVRDALNRPRRA
jgi:predicted anti-sigma-YlaC factor YlaD